MSCLHDKDADKDVINNIISKINTQNTSGPNLLDSQEVSLHSLSSQLLGQLGYTNDKPNR